MINEKNKTYTLWILFALTVIIPIADESGLTFFGLNSVKYVLPIIVLLLHSFWLFGFKKSLLILLPPYFIGLLFEVIGVNYGVIFGGHYFYNPTSLGPLLLNVPILIPFFWSFFVYTAYVITSSFLLWLGIDKPSRNNKNIWFLPLLILVDGLIVVAIDLFMDPIMVAMHNWTWLDGGPYFNIPLGNFIGWFLVSVISTTIFRAYEYNFPVSNTSLPKNILLIPVVGYGLLSLMFLILAINFKLNNLAVIGVSIMMPFTFVNLLLYAKSKRNQKNI